MVRKRTQRILNILFVVMQLLMEQNSGLINTAGTVTIANSVYMCVYSQ